MAEILHPVLPPDLVFDAPLPGVRPLADGRWLRVDEAYDAQMAYRRHLLAERRPQVLWQDDAAQAAVEELFAAALASMPALGFTIDEGCIRCPVGHSVRLDADRPLAVLGQVVQEDLCLMERRGDEHVLTAAVLCFPARWTLAEKAGKPLTRIHKTVQPYDEGMAKRVQRLFDGVQVGRPLWRNNMLQYHDPDLHQPISERPGGQLPPRSGRAPYVRAERQCIVRLPQTQAVIFSIHTYVTRRVSKACGQGPG